MLLCFGRVGSQMNMKLRVLAITGGVIITLITGLVPGLFLFTESGFQALLGPLLGASNYGLPLVWRTVIVYPGSPTNYHFLGLVVDIVVWVLIAWAFLAIGTRLRK
jgi:hypothetical protein